MRGEIRNWNPDRNAVAANSLVPNFNTEEPTVPMPRKEKTRKAKDDADDPRTNYKLIKLTSGNRHRLSKNGNGRCVKVYVRLLPQTRLLVTLANEEVEARRKAGHSEAKIWRDCQKAPLTFVKRGFKRLLSNVGLSSGLSKR
jgi:hypothetical protein